MASSAISTLTTAYNKAASAGPSTEMQAMRARAGNDPMLNFQLDMMELQKKDALDNMFVQAHSAIDDKAQKTAESIIQRMG